MAGGELMNNKSLLLAVFMAITTQSFAQSFYNKGSIVSVMPGTIFTVQDSLINEGTFTNNGSLVMQGAWLNNGTYHSGAGEIKFSSAENATPQVINHNNQSFSKLTISGGGVKLILADITIEDAIVLEDGVIHARDNARVIINDEASITGGSDESHIHAPVYREGGGPRLYPLGDGEKYLPVTLDAQGDTDVMIGVEAVRWPTTPSFSSPSLIPSEERYWVLDFGDGSSRNAYITLPVRDEHGLSDIDDVVVAESPGDNTLVSLGRSTYSGDLANGFVVAERPVKEPMVMLAATINDGAVMVYNALSPNGDDKNDFVVIGNIESYPDNRFTVFNRWGDKVFEITGYDNRERVFRGRSNLGDEKVLVNGTYFYTLEGSNGLKKNGFIVLRN